MDNKEKLIRKLSDSGDSLPRHPMVFYNPGYEFAKKRVWARLSEKINAEKPAVTFSRLFSFRNISLASVAFTSLFIAGYIFLQKSSTQIPETPMLFATLNPLNQTLTSVNLTKNPFTAKQPFRLTSEMSLTLTGKEISELVGSKVDEHATLALREGDLTVDYTRKSQNETLSIKAGHHIVTVIGTVFTTELHNDMFTLTVFEGKVLVKNGSKQVLVNAGNKYQAENKPDYEGKLVSLNRSSGRSGRAQKPRIPVREISEKEIEKILGNQP